MGGNASVFSIESTTGQLKTRAALDYERKSSYTVTVRARDPSGGYVNLPVTITVTNVDEDGTATLSTSQPRVGAAVTATVRDPDGGVSNENWQWRRADDAAGTGQQDITGETDRSYTPVNADANKYLSVAAIYEDALGAGKTAESTRVRVGAANTPRTGGGNNSPNNNANNNGGSLNQGPNNVPKTVITGTLSAAYSSATYRVNEGSAVRVTVRLSSAAAQAVRIPVTVRRGSAESGDYRVSGLSGGALNFGRGSRSASFTITALQDSDTHDETLTLAFGTLPGRITAGSIPRATLTINDDDPPKISISYGSASYRVNEGSAAQVTVQLSRVAPSALHVPITVSRGTAESGDYQVSGLSGGALSFSQGSHQEFHHNRSSR